MLKRTIKFKDFNEVETEEIHYFNLSKSELVELEVSFNGGLEATINGIVEAKDAKTLFSHFKTLILSAYGKKSPDGRTFIKNDEIRREFEQTAAYDALFMELIGDQEKGVAFIQGILPSDLREEIDAQEKAKQELQAKTAEKLGIDKPQSTADLSAQI